MKKYNPTTPSSRQTTLVEYPRKIQGSFKPLLRRLRKAAGRNSQGRITVRHQGGGNKKLYRQIDFKLNKFDIPGRIEQIEYDPFRTGFVALVVYQDGERRYLLIPQGMKQGDEIITSAKALLKPGNRTILKRILVGTFVYNIELAENKGAQLVRSAGTGAQVLAHEDGFTQLKLPSGEIRKVPWSGCATLGQVSNPEHNLVVHGKAGRSRWKGIRPTVRGSVMNPRDHPYGGGEGRSQRGTRKPRTKWGKITGGRKTRKKGKMSNVMIIQKRK